MSSLQLKLDETLQKYPLFNDFINPVLAQYYLLNQDEEEDEWEEKLSSRYPICYRVINNLILNMDWRDLFYMCQYVYRIKGHRGAYRKFCSFLGVSCVFDDDEGGTYNPYSAIVTVGSTVIRDFISFDEDMTTLLYEMLYLDTGLVQIDYSVVTLEYVAAQESTLGLSRNLIQHLDSRDIIWDMP